MGVDLDGRTEPIVAGPGVGPALGLTGAIVHEARANGSWERLKACPGRHCGWAFYDTLAEPHEHLVLVRVCGGREKARACRRRARGRHT